MAVDTGSDSILVAGKDCKGCDYNEMNGMELPSPSGVSTIMNYGSQSDSTKVHQVSLFLRGTNLNKDAVCVHDMGKVHIVTKRHGTSDYNILGLGKEMGSGGPPTFLKKLYGAPPFGYTMGIDTKKKAHITFSDPITTRSWSPSTSSPWRRWGRRTTTTSTLNGYRPNPTAANPSTPKASIKSYWTQGAMPCRSPRRSFKRYESGSEAASCTLI